MACLWESAALKCPCCDNTPAYAISFLNKRSWSSCGLTPEHPFRRSLTHGITHHCSWFLDYFNLFHHWIWVLSPTKSEIRQNLKYEDLADVAFEFWTDSANFMKTVKMLGQGILLLSKNTPRIQHCWNDSRHKGGNGFCSLLRKINEQKYVYNP